MTIDHLLSQYRINSARMIPTITLDAELLLAHTLGVDRSWLHAHGSEELESLKVGKFERLVKRRLNREPIAYIIGEKEFFGRGFVVTPDVLIPRPETEDLIDLTLASVQSQTLQRVIDVGTGSGCVGITLKLERPEWDVTLSDISPKALAIARKNAKNLGVEVTLTESNLLYSLKANRYNLIVANLPYVSRDWQTSPETAFEPQSALYADNAGLALMYQLVSQSPSRLYSAGSLVLEADPEQHPKIIERARQNGFSHHETRGYALSFVKIL